MKPFKQTDVEESIDDMVTEVLQGIEEIEGLEIDKMNGVINLKKDLATETTIDLVEETEATEDLLKPVMIKKETLEENPETEGEIPKTKEMTKQVRVR